MNNSTFHMAYLSEAVSDMNEGEILRILNSARANNAKLGITGFLSCKSGHFLQLLEGEENKVVSMFNKISLDERHANVKIVYEGMSHARLFEKWSMAYQRLDVYSLTLRNRIEDMVGHISRGEMLYKPKDVLTLFEEIRIAT